MNEIAKIRRQREKRTDIILQSELQVYTTEKRHHGRQNSA